MISKTGIMALVCAMLAAVMPLPAGAGGDVESLEQYLAQVGDWRERRHQRLQADDGWMTLVGLEWLHEGDNRVGSAPSRAILKLWKSSLFPRRVLKYPPAVSS